MTSTMFIPADSRHKLSIRPLALDAQLVHPQDAQRLHTRQRALDRQKVRVRRGREQADVDLAQTAATAASAGEEGIELVPRLRLRDELLDVGVELEAEALEPAGAGDAEGRGRAPCGERAPPATSDAPSSLLCPSASARSAVCACCVPWLFEPALTRCQIGARDVLMDADTSSPHDTRDTDPSTHPAPSRPPRGGRRRRRAPPAGRPP